MILRPFYIGLCRATPRPVCLHLLTGITPAATEKDYARFHCATDFDYARDLDALAGGVNDNNEIFFLLRGRFNWTNFSNLPWPMAEYARTMRAARPAANRTAGSTSYAFNQIPLRWLSAEVKTAADLMRPPGRRVQDLPLGDPVWVQRVAGVDQRSDGLAEAFADFRDLAAARRIGSALRRTAEHGDEAFTVQFEAAFRTPRAPTRRASNCRCRPACCELELARENQQPNPADLTGLLTAGTFQVGSTRLFGSWPVKKELLEALQ